MHFGWPHSQAVLYEKGNHRSAVPESRQVPGPYAHSKASRPSSTFRSRGGGLPSHRSSRQCPTRTPSRYNSASGRACVGGWRRSGCAAPSPISCPSRTRWCMLGPKGFRCRQWSCPALCPLPCWPLPSGTWNRLWHWSPLDPVTSSANPPPNPRSKTHRLQSGGRFASGRTPTTAGART